MQARTKSSARRGFEVYTVGVTVDPITTAMGMKVTPSYTLEDGPEPDVIIIPGGGVTKAQSDPKIIKWIQESEKEVDHILSVCNGAFILAKDGPAGRKIGHDILWADRRVPRHRPEHHGSHGQALRRQRKDNHHGGAFFQA